MKTILKTFLVLLLISATALSVISCDDGLVDGMIVYDDAGLKYRLPPSMEPTKVNYADVSYANEDRVEFFIYFYSADELLTKLYIDKDSTVLEYADEFIRKNEYINVDMDYDEENRKITLSYVYEPEDVYYFDYIIRSDTNLYHVTMTCYKEYMEEYIPIFEEWARYIELSALR